MARVPPSVRPERAPASGDKILTAGVDIGTRTVKIALLAHEAGTTRVVAAELVPVQGRRDARDAEIAIRESWTRLLRAAAVSSTDVALVASTGAHERAVVRVGHFYRRLSLAAGVRFLSPNAKAVVDIGARQMRCTLLSGAGVNSPYAATRRDLVCGGEVLEAIARRSGVPVDAVDLTPAGVAVCDDLSARAAKLLGGMGVDGPTVMTGAVALNRGFVRILAARLAEDRIPATLVVLPDAIFAGAYGAALLAARRYQRVMGAGARQEAASRRRHLSRTDRLILN